MSNGTRGTPHSWNQNLNLGNNPQGTLAALGFAGTIKSSRTEK